MRDRVAGIAAWVLGAVVVIVTTSWWRRKRRCALGQASQSREETIVGTSDVNAAGSSAAEDDEAVEARLAEIFEDVKHRSKGVCLIVSNKANSAFAATNLATYLKQKGLSPCSGTALADMVANAELLVELLERKGDVIPSLASTMRHLVVRQGVSSEKLLALFPSMKAAYMQQPLDYGRNSRYGDKWRISCYLVVMENWKPKILPHQPMVDCMEGVMHECVQLFEQWYCEHKKLTSAKASVMNAFVTRYRPVEEENQLKKHIDGANVDGSVILALPTDDPFEGGNLIVWDGRPQQELTYTMESGDIMFLDNGVWHQAKPITAGTRWALVLFLRLHAGAARPAPS